ncbi:LAMI_0G17238g1_1 [Lachancea mirantina]|uniref:rRNA-processing protein FYV7 n=1 Tax=Lachancea mirantina TaxID=1230905 RepID=A0A1G4KCZ0_9SACH|nr:LAMI_0G17238g1_1 [Lachancea mirantina]
MPPKIYKHTKEHKLREIQKSLTKKARLRKEYLKTLKQENLSLPKKDEASPRLSYREAKTQKAAQRKEDVERKKELKIERKRLEKDRYLSSKQDEKQKLEDIRKKHEQRSVRSKKLTQRTKSGQPLMGPKIEDLLEKIKTDETYTK